MLSAVHCPLSVVCCPVCPLVSHNMSERRGSYQPPMALIIFFCWQRGVGAGAISHAAVNGGVYQQAAGGLDWLGVESAIGNREMQVIRFDSLSSARLIFEIELWSECEWIEWISWLGRGNHHYHYFRLMSATWCKKHFFVSKSPKVQTI